MKNLHHICYTPSCSIRTRKLYDEKGIISAAGCADRLFRWGGQLSGIKNTLPGVHRGGHWGDPVSSDIFADYDATIVNFWNNGCGTCIEEMPELEEYYQDFEDQNINLMGVASDSGESEEQLETAPVSSDIFADYDATIVNFWNNGCGTCIEEMPELEEYYQDFEDQNINLMGVASDSGESEEQLETAREILEEKGVTYTNLSPDPENSLYQDFISQLTGYPTTYVVDSEGNIVGAPIIGNLKEQEETLNHRLEQAKGA